MGRIAKPKIPHPLDARPVRPAGCQTAPPLTDIASLEYVEHLLQWWLYHEHSVPVMVAKHPYWTVVDGVDLDSADPGEWDAIRYKVTLWRDQKWPGTWSALASGVLLAIMDVPRVAVLTTKVQEARYATPAAMQVGITCQYVTCEVTGRVVTSIEELEAWLDKFKPARSAPT